MRDGDLKCWIIQIVDKKKTTTTLFHLNIWCVCVRLPRENAVISVQIIIGRYIMCMECSTRLESV